MEDISERLQCPPDYVGVTAIAGLGSLIGCRAGIKPQEKTDWMETPNLWAIFIGRPGMLKSPAMGEALGPLKHLEREAAKENEVAQLAYAAGLSHYKVRQQVKLSLEKDALKHSLLENQQAQRGREIKNAAPPQTLKTLKTGFEGFEGGQGCHVFRFEGGPEGNGVCTNEVARGPENQKLPPPRTVKTVKTRPPMDVSSLSCASVAPFTLN